MNVIIEAQHSQWRVTARKGHAMKKIILDCLNHMRLGKPQTHNNLVVFPWLADQEISMDYILLDEATDANQVTMSEDFEDGIVTELTIENRSGENILMLDGEELIGTKQKRVLNTTMLIPAHSVIAIPVCCVERRRWYYQGRGVMSKDRVLLKRNMAVNESIPVTESFPSHEKAKTRNFWDIASKEATPDHVDEPTRIIDSPHEDDPETIDEDAKHFTVEQNQVGILVMSNNRVIGCEYLGKNDTLRKTFLKRMNHAILHPIDRDRRTCTPSRRKACTFLNDIRLSTVRGRPSLSLGTEMRLESPNLKGSALSLGKELVHLAVFANQG